MKRRKRYELLRIALLTRNPTLLRWLLVDRGCSPKKIAATMRDYYAAFCGPDEESVLITGTGPVPESPGDRAAQ